MLDKVSRTVGTEKIKNHDLPGFIFTGSSGRIFRNQFNSKFFKRPKLEKLRKKHSNSFKLRESTPSEEWSTFL